MQPQPVDLLLRDPSIGDGVRRTRRRHVAWVTHVDRSWLIEIEGLHGGTRAESLRDIEAAARAFVAGRTDDVDECVDLDVRLAAHVPHPAPR